MSPPCEDFLTADRVHAAEMFYPLDVRICDRCLLVQLPTYLSASSIFSEYAYFSSYSDSWVEHARRLVQGGADLNLKNGDGASAAMKRAGQPNEVAPCYVFLASDDGSYMTGQVLHPNGGTVING